MISFNLSSASLSYIDLMKERNFKHIELTITIYQKNRRYITYTMSHIEHKIFPIEKLAP